MSDYPCIIVMTEGMGYYVDNGGEAASVVRECLDDGVVPLDVRIAYAPGEVEPHILLASEADALDFISDEVAQAELDAILHQTV